MEEIGHCVRKTCASSLFSTVVKEKLTRDWTGHWSFKYEKISEVKSTAVSEVLTVTWLSTALAMKK